MTRLTSTLKKTFTFIFKYKYTIICTIYLFIIILMRGSIKMYGIYNVLSILLILNILSKTKYTTILTLLLSFIISFDAYFSFAYREFISMGAFSSIMETDSGEVSGVILTVLPIAIVILTITSFLFIRVEKELKEVKLARRWSILILLVYWIYIGFGIYNHAMSDLKKSTKVQDHANYKISPMSIISNYAPRKFPLGYNVLYVFIAYQMEMLKFREKNARWY